MGFWHAYTACAAGVILSILIPVLAEAVRQLFNTGEPAGIGRMRLLRLIWRRSRPYAVLGVFSLAVALLIVAFLGDALKTWQSALIGGYLWDSTLQKIAGKP